MMKSLFILFFLLLKLTIIQTFSFRDILWDNSYNEWNNYKGNHECNDASMKKRMGEYWKVLGSSLDGGDLDIPWSDALVSYMVHQSGGRDITFSTAHRDYIRDTFTGKGSLYRSVKSTNNENIGLGDLVCYGYGDYSSWVYAKFYDWYRRGAKESVAVHCDIVLGINIPQRIIQAVGGNIGQKVAMQS